MNFFDTHFSKKVAIMLIYKNLSKTAVKIIRNFFRIAILVLVFYPQFANNPYINDNFFYTPDNIRFTAVGDVIPEIVSIVTCITGQLLPLSIIFFCLIILNKNLWCGFLGCLQYDFNSKIYAKEAMFYAIPYIVFTHILALYLVFRFLYKGYYLLKR